VPTSTPGGSGVAPSAVVSSAERSLIPGDTAGAVEASAGGVEVCARGGTSPDAVLDTFWAAASARRAPGMASASRDRLRSVGDVAASASACLGASTVRGVLPASGLLVGVPARMSRRRVEPMVGHASIKYKIIRDMKGEKCSDSFDISFVDWVWNGCKQCTVLGVEIISWYGSSPVNGDEW